MSITKFDRISFIVIFSSGETECIVAVDGVYKQTEWDRHIRRAQNTFKWQASSGRTFFVNVYDICKDHRLVKKDRIALGQDHG
ncbi:BZ3500_MvSof-1268-A1-R1_Chr2-1g04112 [Microbotryum saponariae]|uniref:BZ3500_MvSof-1268-A1-R1_Chr2-1g04112 protein n=1 Tax=Microbotryum saponariae TaxID=289078 RepID=A0A2X0K786_9BASI|nr:BZ3500_MvSof-1268-A1-R1_Chr2-1g04112 [Microbotryum saponariae]SCZ91099.1 BZ3501_MvSof-1269-A2-R1_Chr2-1g03768 [Microbotryum saponariae]